jgi:hypothetical protein
MEMRPTGAVKANSGGASVKFLAAKIGNSIDQNRKLQKRECQSTRQRFEQPMKLATRA